MLTTTLRGERRATESTVTHLDGRPRPVLLPAATIVLGVAVSFLVVRDGSPLWQFTRVLVTIAATAAATVGLRHWPRWSAGVTAVCLGVIGTALGAGVGIPHAVKGGDVAQSVAGFVCLLAGLILLIGGVASFTRSVRGWLRVAILLVAGLVVVPLVYSLGIGVAATNVPRTSLGQQTPADWGLVYLDVDFPATDGVTLSGWYIPGDNGAAVVLLHGAGSTRSAVLDHAAVLAGHGYGVLLYDARGHGRSAGRAMDFGWFGDEDVGGAVSYLAAQPGVHGMAAVGLSMGGEEAIGAAATDDRIDAVVAEGATGRVPGDHAWLPDEYGIRGRLQRPVDWLTYTAADALTDARMPTTLHAAAAATSSPILLIAAGNVADEAHAARYIASASPDSVEVWEVPDTGHTAALASRPTEWETHVITFLDRALGRP
jgi:uncharacterized protein